MPSAGSASAAATLASMIAPSIAAAMRSSGASGTVNPIASATSVEPTRCTARSAVSPGATDHSVEAATPATSTSSSSR